MRAVRRLYPVSNRFHGARWLVRIGGRRHATPLLLALAAIVFADLAFAIDSIPAAFAITRDPLLIWMGNIFALLGLRALFVLVDGLIRPLRFMDQTIAAVLGAVAVKLLVEDLVHIGPALSLAIVAAIFATGIAASLIAQRREVKPSPGPHAVTAPPGAGPDGEAVTAEVQATPGRDAAEPPFPRERTLARLDASGQNEAYGCLNGSGEWPVGR